MVSTGTRLPECLDPPLPADLPIVPRKSLLFPKRLVTESHQLIVMDVHSVRNYDAKKLKSVQSA
jgi:hypothetical protein